jgi:hypothetical protein
MRIASALAACALFASAAASVAPAAAQGSGAWSYAYINNEAVATERDSQGEITTTISCRPPSGELVIASYPLSRAGGGNKDVTITIGDFRMETQGRVQRAGDERALVVRLQQSPPVIAGGRSRTAPVVISAGGRSHTLAPGGGQRLSDIAIACWSAA